MHEFGIARTLLETAERQARQHGAGRILEVRCRVGVLQPIIPELLTEAFRCLADASGHAGARLRIERVPVAIRCRRCGQSTSSLDWQINCPGCGSFDVQVDGGQELELVGLTAEASDADRGAA